MKNTLLILAVCWLAIPLLGQAEILAMANYESKPDDALKDLKMPFGTKPRREGVAIFDVDPASDNYGNILIDILLPADLVAHHLLKKTVAADIRAIFNAPYQSGHAIPE